MGKACLCIWSSLAASGLGLFPFCQLLHRGKVNSPYSLWLEGQVSDGTREGNSSFTQPCRQLKEKDVCALVFLSLCTGSQEFTAQTIITFFFMKIILPTRAMNIRSFNRPQERKWWFCVSNQEGHTILQSRSLTLPYEALCILIPWTRLGSSFHYHLRHSRISCAK